MKNQLVSKRLNVNAGIIEWYTKELKKLSREMTTECNTKLAEIYKKLSPEITFDGSISSQTRIALNELQKKYGDKFARKSKVLVNTLLKRTNKYSIWLLNSVLKNMLGDGAKDFTLAGSAISKEKEEIIKALMFENVSLIKSIPNEYFKQITGALARSIENGDGIKWLASELKSYGAKTQRRADLIAQDQTRKAFNSINLRNFQEANIRKFKWLHSGGSRDPRKYHKDVLDGQIFDLDKGAPNESGKNPAYIYPGQEPYCRCVMCAVLDFED